MKTYLKPKNHAIVQGMAKVENISVSETINYIVTQFAKRLPENERVRYLFANSGTQPTDNDLPA